MARPNDSQSSSTDPTLQPTPEGQLTFVASLVENAASHAARGESREPTIGGLISSLERFSAPFPLGLAADRDLVSRPINFRAQHEVDVAMIRRHLLHTAFHAQSLQRTQAIAAMALPSFPWGGSTGALPLSPPTHIPILPAQSFRAGTGPAFFSSYPPTLSEGNFHRLAFDAEAASTLLHSPPVAAATVPTNKRTAKRPLSIVETEPLVALASPPPSTEVAESSAMLQGFARNQNRPVHAKGSVLDAPQHDESISLFKSTGQRKVTFPMWSEDDKKAMTEYQCLLRRQIEYFVADHDDLRVKAQGRNKPIRLSQVGIRCRHCAQVVETGVATGPSRSATKARASRSRQGAAVARSSNPQRGAVYYPSRASNIFQAVQNVACNHFVSGACPYIPSSILEEIVSLKEKKSAQSRQGKGKRYWAQSAARLGIVDTGTDDTAGDPCLVLRRG